MRSIYNYVISPIGGRYNNSVAVGGDTLIVNTEISNHKFINRNAEVISIPSFFNTNVKVGDEAIVHHNIFRRWYDVKGNERNSSNYINESLYKCFPDQLYLYRTGKEEFKSPDEFCFVKPFEIDDFYEGKKLVPLKGELIYLNEVMINDGFKKGDVVGFTKDCEFEFEIEGELLYRVLTKDICLNYEW